MSKKKNNQNISRMSRRIKSYGIMWLRVTIKKLQEKMILPMERLRELLKVMKRDSCNAKSKKRNWLRRTIRSFSRVLSKQERNPSNNTLRKSKMTKFQQILLLSLLVSLLTSWGRMETKRNPRLSLSNSQVTRMSQTRIVDFASVYEPLPHQQKVHDSPKFKKALIGGFGCGKSKFLAAEALKLSVINRGCYGGVFGPTYDEVLRKVMLPEITGMLDGLGVAYNYHGTKKLLTIPLWDGRLWFFSAHDPAKIKGPTLAFSVCDEPGLYKEKSWQVILTRVRDPRAKKLQHVFGGTPEGMGWLYDILITKGKEEDTFVKFASTRDNIHLPEYVVEQYYEQFPARIAKMYLEGQFMPLAEAQVYFAYNPERHDDKKLAIQKHIPLNIGIDFNIRNMYAEVNQIARKDVFHPLEITAFETKELAENIYEDLNGHYPWHLFPDASGQYKDSKGISDFQILHDVFAVKGLKLGKHYFMHYPPANGNVRDRTNALNCLMENAKGESHYFINPTRCPKARRDYMQVSYKENSREIDKSNNKLTHPSDAEGYMAVRKFPIRPTWRIS